MNAVLHENHLEHYGIIYTGRKSFEVSGETVVPDKMPDIGQLGDTIAHVLLRSKRTESGRCVMEGSLSITVSFLPDGAAGLRVLNMEIPWQTEFASDEIGDGSMAVGTVQSVRMDTRLLNPRKLLVKVELLGEITVYEKQASVIYDGVEDGQNIQVYCESADVSLVSTVCERTFAATDEYPLPADLSGPEIIGKSVQFRVEDVKTLTNKLIIKGTVLSDVVIASESGESEKVSFTSGFSFIAETDRDRVSDDVCVSIMPTAMYYEPASNGRVLSMEVHAVCQMVVYEKKTITYLSDAYSNFYDCSCGEGELSVFTDMKVGQQRESVNGVISCRSQISRVCFLTAACMHGDEKEALQTSVQISACVRYENGMHDWVKKTVTVPIKKKPADRVSSLRLGDLYGVVNGTELEYRLTVDYELREENKCSLKLLTSVSFDEDQPIGREQASLIVVRSEGRLWDLARKYGSTVSLIKAYNGLEDQEIDAKTLLLIPRQRK